jgi:hypothetical protein
MMENANKACPAPLNTSLHSGLEGDGGHELRGLPVAAGKLLPSVGGDVAHEAATGPPAGTANADQDAAAVSDAVDVGLGAEERVRHGGRQWWGCSSRRRGRLFLLALTCGGAGKEERRWRRRGEVAGKGRRVRDGEAAPSHRSLPGLSFVLGASLAHPEPDP